MTSSNFSAHGRDFPRIGFGAMSLTKSSGLASDEHGIKVLEKALEIGCTLWDTADIYGSGENESLLSEVLKKRENREKVFLVTKWGFRAGGGLNFDASPDYAPEAMEASIKRLGTNPDAWILHRVPKDHSIESVVEAMDTIRSAGKTRYIGIGECSAETLRRASKVAKIDFIESEYSPFCLNIERNGVLEVCKELNVKILAFSPLGKGFLTAKYRKADDFDVAGDSRLTVYPRLGRENFDKNFKIVEELERLANVKGCTSGQLTLAWATHQSELIIPIPGTKTVKYLEENFGAVKVKLTVEELKELRKVIEANQPVGDRFIPSMQTLLDA